MPLEQTGRRVGAAAHTCRVELYLQVFGSHRSEAFHARPSALNRINLWGAAGEPRTTRGLSAGFRPRGVPIEGTATPHEGFDERSGRHPRIPNRMRFSPPVTYTGNYVPLTVEQRKAVVLLP
jgi:hypothetical protein